LLLTQFACHLIIQSYRAQFKEGTMRRTISLSCYAGIALTLLLSTNVSVRADLRSWTYNWEPGSTKLPADAGGSGWIALTDESSKSATGFSNTVVTNIRAFSSAPQSAPDQFNHAGYTFTLNLRDNASLASGGLTFSGFFSGSLTGNNANIKNTFTSPTTQTLTLGGNTYTVTMGTYTPPGPPGAVNAGSLNALVTGTPGNGGGGVNGVLEPSTLTLAVLALPVAGLLRWRRWKSNAMPSMPSLASLIA
jgi:hypothetical protein